MDMVPIYVARQMGIMDLQEEVVEEMEMVMIMIVEVLVPVETGMTMLIIIITIREVSIIRISIGIRRIVIITNVNLHERIAWEYEGSICGGKFCINICTSKWDCDHNGRYEKFGYHNQQFCIASGITDCHHNHKIT